MSNTAGPSIRLNGTTEDLYFDEEPAGQVLIEALISHLASNDLQTRRQLGRSHAVTKCADERRAQRAAEAVVLAAHGNNLVLLSPHTFATASGRSFSTETIMRFAEATPLGRSVLNKPSFAEAMRRPTNETAQLAYQQAFHRVVAALAMGSHGITDLAKIPKADFLDWFAHFRTQNGLRWNRALWSKGQRAYMEVALRALALAYSDAACEPGAAAFASQKRSDAIQVMFWHNMVHNTPPHLVEWLKWFQAWRASTSARTGSQHRSAFLQLGEYLTTAFKPAEVANPRAFLSRQHNYTFANHLSEERSDDSRKKPGKSMVTALRHATTFSDFIISQLVNDGAEGRFWPLSTAADERELLSIAKENIGAKHAHAQSRPLPIGLYKLAREILEEGEAGWPGRQKSCTAMLEDGSGALKAVYCPVLPTLILAEYELPCRVGQMKRLDSGEGDLRRYNGLTGAWEKNPSSTAGYWSRQPRPEPDAGYAYEQKQDGFTGFFINTNKTGKPYIVPWPNSHLHALLYKLRLWQEHYNPISKPITPSQYVDDMAGAEAEKLSGLPSIFPLFRMPGGMPKVTPGVPPNYRKTNQFWQDLMAEVQRRWNAANPHDQKHFVKQNLKTKQYYGSHYNLHGLRVMLITLFYDAGVPIEVIQSVLAGHKSILMSIYYLVRNPAWYAAQLEEAAQRRASVEQARAMAELKDAELPLAVARAAALSSNALAVAVAMGPIEKSGWIDMGIGICPYDGSRCHDGGECIRKDIRRDGSDHSQHAPVDGGSQNCVSCRHFLSGPAWLVPLQIFGTRAIRRLTVLQQQVNRLTASIDGFRTSRSSLVLGSPEYTKLSALIARHEQQLKDLGDQQQSSAKTFFNTKRYIESCCRLQEERDDAGATSLVALGDGYGKVGFVDASDFEQAMQIVAFSEIYPILHDVEAERSLESMLDGIVYDGQPELAALRPLAPEAAEKATRAASRYLLASLSREELRAVSDGRITVARLGHAEGAVEAAKVAFGLPIDVLTALSPPSGQQVQLQP